VPKKNIPTRIPKDAPLSFTEILLFGEGKQKDKHFFNIFNKYSVEDAKVLGCCFKKKVWPIQTD